MGETKRVRERKDSALVFAMKQVSFDFFFWRSIYIEIHTHTRSRGASAPPGPWDLVVLYKPVLYQAYCILYVPTPRRMGLHFLRMGP